MGVVVATLGLAAPAAVDQAEAASCKALEARLASIKAGRPDRAKAARYARSIKRQRGELDRTRRMAARSNCGTSGGSRECRRITAAIGDMERRLSELERERRKALGGTGSNATRRSIRAQMKRRGCGERRQTASLARPATRAGRSVARPDIPSAPPVAPAATYRTMCVRTCDGYYFPVRDATTKDTFRGDATRCAALCPQAKTKLFMHPLPGDAMSMIDRFGRAYRTMPYAFRHTQQSYRPSASCSCGKPSLTPAAQTALRGTSEDVAPIPDGPVLRNADGETARNAAVGFGWDAAEALVVQGRDVAPSDTPVRVVGPRFLPDR